MSRTFRSSALLPLALLSLSGVARADEPITVDLVAKGQQGASWPALVLRGHQPVDQLSVSLACGAVKVQRSGTLGSGEKLEIPLEVPLGRTTCKGKLLASFGDDEGELPLSFEVTLLPPMKITVPRDRLDLEARQLVLSADRAVARVEIEAYGESGDMIGHGETEAGGVGAGGAVDASWSASPGDVLRLHVQVQDTDGFWAGVDLFPWSYNIPHEDVVFDTARWEILAQEEPKLQAALEQARGVLQRFSATQIAMNLYVGGYTDTVGDAGSNQVLSGHRAQAIAHWFEAHGFEHPIFYQGFGEGALAVSTPDETDEQANRRANYVIAAESPPPCAEFPRTAWQRLD
ncbi:MAG: OmpA family protein [Pseudomonadota bacterium]